MSLTETFTYDPLTGLFTWARPTRTALVGDPAGSVYPVGYVYLRFERKAYLAHRVAWLFMLGEWPTHEIDHIDGVRTNNSWANLREVTSRVNRENQRKAKSNNRSTGLLGAYPVGRRFKAVIEVHGRQIHLGMFATAEEAHIAYVTAKRNLHEGCTL